MNKLKKLWMWLFVDEDKIIIRDCKNSKIIINGKVVFDDTKNK